ncbi:PilW family protein [Deinococcus sp. QL22]|uniref:PilW family protein n=1 Tax=Deinococcus sp. QL22 TaxID=2939437 RepID=UPI00201730B2|nr:prepilin-type N-terminal cleavage/methylation domain-containing protein [Deinococcus sp. QL22]UQN09991.1 prepilin-type N-terminal cleavage/methylation domain-containing protein [Deinococcus sp. QL22]
MRPSRDQGFTIIELLVASSISLVVFGILLNMFLSTTQVQAKSQLQLSVDESMRASIELMGMDLREATATRVIDAASATVLNLGPFVATSNQLSVVSSDPDSTFPISQPLGYPNNKSLPNSAETDISPSATTKLCKKVFGGGDYFIVTNGNDPYVYFMQAHATNPCPSAAKVLHPKQQLRKPNGDPFQWSPTAQLSKVIIMRYYIGQADGASALMRQQAGDTPQVVAYDITGLTVAYSADGATFAPTASGLKAVRITLTGQRERGKLSSTVTLSSTVYMRDLVVPSRVAGSAGL